MPSQRKLNSPLNGQVDLTAMPDAEVARILDARVRDLERQHRRSFIELGLICVEMSDRSLWRELVDPETGNFFQSFSSWLADATLVSRSAAYCAMKALKDITDVPIAELEEMPRCNVMTLQRLSPQVRQDPKVIEAAKTLSADGFLQMIEEEFAGQHLERNERMALNPTRGARKMIDEALSAAGVLYGVEGREAQIEVLSAFFMMAECEFEQYEGMSNRRAYEIALSVGTKHAETHADTLA